MDTVLLSLNLSHTVFASLHHMQKLKTRKSKRITAGGGRLNSNYIDGGYIGVMRLYWGHIGVMGSILV